MAYVSLRLGLKRLSEKIHNIWKRLDLINRKKFIGETKSFFLNAIHYRVMNLKHVSKRNVIQH